MNYINIKINQEETLVLPRPDSKAKSDWDVDLKTLNYVWATEKYMKLLAKLIGDSTSLNRGEVCGEDCLMVMQAAMVFGYNSLAKKIGPHIIKGPWNVQD